jgi:hypothetical protein
MDDGDLGWSTSMKVTERLGGSGWETVTRRATSAGLEFGVQDGGAEKTSPVAAGYETFN